MAGAGNLIGIRTLAAVQHIIPAIAANGVGARIAGDDIGRIVADYIKRRLAEQRQIIDAATECEGVAGILRLPFDFEVVLGDGQ